ncbi:MAG: aromatic amino acid lyase, partial [Robiginitomaculum sp.]|nr:aromatic amino acid lyase [Robiginitomaculum sp.]
MSKTIQAGHASLDVWRSIYRDGMSIKLGASAKPACEKSAAIVEAAAAGSDPVYGVNTGFGKLAHVKIAPQDTEKLQENLILSHCCGVGDPLDDALTRLMMVLKLMSLGRGASGVRWVICQQIEMMLEHGVIPVIPHQGSVGASGDLAPLAHMAAVMIGAGEAAFQGQIMPGREALTRAGMEPMVLGPKEGLALINGTQFSTALALAGLFEAERAVANSIVIASLSTDAIMGSTAPLVAEIHALRGHAGQIEVAAQMRALMDGSEIRESHREGDTRVQ